LIPEAISFSIIAGVDPKVGLYASFSIAIIIAFSGGRPGMISAATGAMALVLVPLVENYGIEYLFAATILAGILQVGLGYLGVGELMRFVPRTVMLGFVNALAILIFMAQVPHILLSDDASRGERWLANGAAILVGLVIIYGLPRITKAVPSPLVAIVAITGAAMIWHLDLPTVGDMGELPSSLPFVALPQLPLAFETLSIIFPVALTLALVGLLESLLTPTSSAWMPRCSNLATHGVEGGDRRRVPDAGVGEVDLDPPDLDRVIVERVHDVVCRGEEQLAGHGVHSPRR